MPKKLCIYDVNGNLLLRPCIDLTYSVSITMINKLLTSLVTILLLSSTALADEQQACLSDDDCIEIGKWQFGLALGYGERSNPIRDYDDIPIYLAPTLAYYGEKWFFDNGNLGYTLAEKEHFSLNLSTSFSSDSAYFYRWDPSNIFISGNSQLTSPSSGFPSRRVPLGTESEPVFNELEDRKFTLLGGAEAFIYTPVGIINIAVAHDLFDVHSGMEGKLKWLYNLTLDDWIIELSATANWKSKEIIDYYYGVRFSENEYWSEHYQASSGTNLGLELTTQYMMNEHWELLFLVRYTDLADAITASPLVNEDHSSTYFIGAAYRF